MSGRHRNACVLPARKTASQSFHFAGPLTRLSWSRLLLEIPVLLLDFLAQGCNIGFDSERASTSSRLGIPGSGSVLSSCIVETMIPMNKFRMVNVAMMMKGTKNAHAHGNTSITGRTIPMDQLSSVMIWKSE
jgi:hypothetical protein